MIDRGLKVVNGGSSDEGILSRRLSYLALVDKFQGIVDGSIVRALACVMHDDPHAAAGRIYPGDMLVVELIDCWFSMCREEEEKSWYSR